MTTSRKRKQSSVRITRPYALRARAVTFHRNNDPTAADASRSTTRVVTVTAPSKTLAMMSLPVHDSESNNSFSEYIENQTDMQHDDSSPAGKEKSSQRKRTMVMEEWLTYRDTYLHEMLRHDGREGLQVTLCADCDKSGNFSCYDCAHSMHYCKDCLVNRHRLMPLHRIRVWRLILSVIWHLKLF
jgi:hypothetical protein